LPTTTRSRLPCSCSGGTYREGCWHRLQNENTRQNYFSQVVRKAMFPLNQTGVSCSL
jgi:hypothetical protein